MTRTVVAGALVLVASSAFATVIRVPSQAPSIQAGVNWSASGDTILIEVGTYTGSMNRGISFSGKSVTLRSESGPDVTVVDCQGLDRAFAVSSGETVRIEGLTVRDGYSVLGGALMIGNGSDVEVCRCRFLDGQATKGGAAYVGLARALFEMCVFSDNTAEYGGVFYNTGTHDVMTGGDITTLDCEFVGNSAYCCAVLYSLYWGTDFTASRCLFVDNSGIGVVSGGGGHFDLSECLFVGNAAGDQGSLIESLGGGTGTVTYTTIVSNSAYCVFFTSAEVTNTIVAYSTTGSVVSDLDIPSFECCDLYGNAGGDWTGPIADHVGTQGNICESPRFCGILNETTPYALQEDSPCADPNSGCGTIGRYGVGCGSTPAEPSTWGAIKALFR